MTTADGVSSARLGAEAGSAKAAGADFPLNGVVALETEDGGERWTELWRLEND